MVLKKKRLYTRWCRRGEHWYQTYSKCGKICDDHSLQYKKNREDDFGRINGWQKERIELIKIKIKLLEKEKWILEQQIKK